MHTKDYGDQTTQQLGTRAGTRKNKAPAHVQGDFVQ